MSYYFSNDLLDLLQLENRHKSSLTRKPTQTTQPTFPSKGKNQKEGIHPKAWEKEPSSRARKKVKRQKYSTHGRTREKLTNQINKKETSNRPEG